MTDTSPFAQICDFAASESITCLNNGGRDDGNTHGFSVALIIHLQILFPQISVIRI